MKPKNWKQGDPISASRLNDGNAEAARSRRQFSMGSGSSMINETLGNQSSMAFEAGARLVIAKEDFSPQESETDIYAIQDPQYSGKCMMMRLNSEGVLPTGLYEEELHSKEFRVWDALALLNNATSKSTGDIFYTIYNKDSKRWEVLSTEATTTIKHAITCRCDGDGWYVIELVDDAIGLQIQPPDCEPSCDGSSASASASSSASADDPCNPCTMNTDLEAACGSASTFESSRPMAIGNGTYAWAYDKRSIPLKIGGMCTVAWLGDVCNDSTSFSSSASDDSTSNRIYTILTGEYTLISIPHEVWECCPIEGVKKVACYTFIAEGTMCIGPEDPCDSASASSSASV